MARLYAQAMTLMAAPHVFRVIREYFKIGRACVDSVSVFVMHHFFFIQWPTKNLLRNQSVNQETLWLAVLPRFYRWIQSVIGKKNSCVTKVGQTRQNSDVFLNWQRKWQCFSRDYFMQFPIHHLLFVVNLAKSSSFYRTLTPTERTNIWTQVMRLAKSQAVNNAAAVFHGTAFDIWVLLALFHVLLVVVLLAKTATVDALRTFFNVTGRFHINTVTEPCLSCQGATNTARGATKTAENQAQETFKAGQGATGTEEAIQGQSYGALMPQIMSMLQPGGNPAVTAATQGSLASRFGAAKQGVMDTAARTNNAASTNATLDSLARTQGQEGAQAAANNVAGQQKTATGLLAQIFGQANAGVPATLNAQTGANNSYINGIKSGNGVIQMILQGAKNAAAGAAGGAAGAAGGGAGRNVRTAQISRQ